jgi:hypothetical protein
MLHQTTYQMHTSHTRSLCWAWEISLSYSGRQKWCEHENPLFHLFNNSPLIRQVFLSRRELRHHPVFTLLRMIWLPKKEMRHPLVKLYQRRIKQG